MTAHIAKYSSTEYTEARVIVTLVGLEHIARVSPHCLVVFQVSIGYQAAYVVMLKAKVAISCITRIGLWQ